MQLELLGVYVETRTSWNEAFWEDTEATDPNRRYLHIWWERTTSDNCRVGIIWSSCLVKRGPRMNIDWSDKGCYSKTIWHRLTGQKSSVDALPWHKLVANPYPILLQEAL